MRRGIEDDVLFFRADCLKPKKVGKFPCGLAELWLSLDYDKEINPQVKAYLNKCTREFQRNYFREKNEKIKDMILNPISHKKVYTTEDGVEINLSRLQVGKIPLQDYKKAHRGMLFGCHDVMLEYKDGLLLVKRDNHPAKDVLWPIGGRIERGVNSKDSLVRKVKEECGLDIDDELIYLGDARTSFQTDPFEHGNGTDTTNERYFARAKGKLNLDKLHKEPIIIKPKDYNPEFRGGLESYVKDFMDISMLFLEEMDPVLLHSYLAESLGIHD